MLENPLYIGERIIDYADIQQDINVNNRIFLDHDLLGTRGVLTVLANYIQFVVDNDFKEQLQNEYGVDMSRPLQYKKFSRPIAVNPYSQEWGYVRLMQFSEYDDQPDHVELIIENPVTTCDERFWNRGEFILIWEGLVHEEITGGIHI